MLKVMYDLAHEDCAQHIGDGGTLTPLQLHTVPTLLLDVIIDKQIDSGKLAARGEPCTGYGIRDRLRVLGLIEHIEAAPREMRINLWDGRILSVKVHRRVNLLDTCTLTVTDEAERIQSITEGESSIRDAVKLTWDGNSLSQKLWGAGAVAETKAAGENTTKARKQKADAGNKIKAESRREFVINFIKEKCGGRWDGTLEALATEIKQKTGHKVSDTTLWRILKGTSHYTGSPAKAAKGRNEREAVAENEGHTNEPLEYHTMPDDVS